MTTLETSRFPRLLRRGIILCGVVLAAAPFLYADETMDRLVRLVGRDAGLCVEIPHLDATLTTFEEGEFFHRLERSKLYAECKTGGPYQTVAGLAKVVEKFTGKPARQFVREIFGTAVVIAAYTEPGPKMSAILMSEAISRETLDTTIQAWNRAGPPRLKAIPFAGRTYYMRTCAAKPGHAALTLYYATLDRTLLLSDREVLVRRALSLSNQSAARASLLELPAYQQARRSLSANSAARAYVNPRAFDPMLGIDEGKSESALPMARRAKQPAICKLAPNSPRNILQSQASALDVPGAPPASAKPANSAVCRTIQAAWRRCEWLAIGLQTDRGVVLEGNAHYSTGGLSASAQRLIQSMSGPAELLHLVPSDSFIVVACRQPFGVLLQKALASQIKQEPPANWESLRQVSRGLFLGLDPLDDILPSFRENFGGYVVARPNAKPDELPFDALLAAELTAPDAAVHRPATTELTAPHTGSSVRDAIDNALNMGLNFAAAYFNSSATGTPAVVRTQAEQGSAHRLRWIDGLGPYRPAYGLTARYLALATSPQAINDFAARDAANNARPAVQRGGVGAAAVARRSPPPIEALANRYFPTENQVLFVDTAALRRFLQAHGSQLVRHATRVRSISAAQAEETIAAFRDVSGLFDTVFAAARMGDGSVRVVLGGIVNGPAASEAASAR